MLIMYLAAAIMTCSLSRSIPMYALLVAGDGLAKEERIMETVSALLAVRNEVEHALKSMGVTGELTPPSRRMKNWRLHLWKEGQYA